jgi:hypothetical protein
MRGREERIRAEEVERRMKPKRMGDQTSRTVLRSV